MLMMPALLLAAGGAQRPLTRNNPGGPLCRNRLLHIHIRASSGRGSRPIAFRWFGFFYLACAIANIDIRLGSIPGTALVGFAVGCTMEVVAGVGGVPPRPSAAASTVLLFLPPPPLPPFPEPRPPFCAACLPMRPTSGGVWRRSPVLQAERVRVSGS